MNSSRRLPLHLLLVVGIFFIHLVGASRAVAQIESFAFMGTIDVLDDAYGVLDPAIQIGSVVEGGYSYDLAIGVPGSILTSVGTVYSNGNGNLSVTVEGQAFSSTNGIAFVISDGRFFLDGLFGDYWSTAIPADIGVIGVTIRFFDSTGAKLSSEDFFVNKTFEGWERAEILFVYRESEETSPFIIASGQITPRTPPASVPSGNRATWLLLLALLPFVALRCSESIRGGHS